MSCVIRLGLPTRRHERWVREETSVRDCARDANEVLHHHAAGAEVQVTDFAIADLSAGKAHRLARGLKERPRRPRPQTIPSRYVRHRDRIAVLLGTVAPAVENEEDDRSGARSRGHAGL
jgi:hypothetical protein